MPPSRPPQGNVTAEDKIKFLSDWLDDALLYGRKSHDRLNLLIDNVTCSKVN